jgi:YidC/Oxa1 family membrane protein insertase
VPQFPFWDQFQSLIFLVLLYIRGFTGDWGMAIILLTIGLRVVLLPLTWHQTKSMVELQRIQPKIKELQEKYKDDKEKQQEETLKFYQENKVNPFGGCLPLILQMPILIALYGVLGGKAPKLGKMLQYLQDHHQTGTFYGVITDIAKTPQTMWNQLAFDFTHKASQAVWGHDLAVLVPYALLVVLFGVSVWLPQALMPGDKQQKMIGGYMAIFMLWFGWVSPAGVLLYWDVSSIWGVVQQQITMTVTKREIEEESPEPKAGKKAKASLTANDSVASKKPSNKKPTKG